MSERAKEQRAPVEDGGLDEIASARAWLDSLRDGVLYKIDGLTMDELRWRPSPTANALGTLVRHLGLAERLWFRLVCAGEEMEVDWLATMFDDLPSDWDVTRLAGFYNDEIAAANAALDTCVSFDEVSRGPSRQTTWRWAAMHMIEEIARHLGHMDITRELIDGHTGR